MEMNKRLSKSDLDNGPVSEVRDILLLRQNHTVQAPDGAGEVVSFTLHQPANVSIIGRESESWAPGPRCHPPPFLSYATSVRWLRT